MEKIRRLSLKGISVQRFNLEIILCAFKNISLYFFPLGTDWMASPAGGVTVSTRWLVEISSLGLSLLGVAAAQELNLLHKGRRVCFLFFFSFFKHNLSSIIVFFFFYIKKRRAHQEQKQDSRILPRSNPLLRFNSWCVKAKHLLQLQSNLQSVYWHVKQLGGGEKNVSKPAPVS